MSKDAIALVRVSSKAQATDDRDGLPRQRAGCKEVAKRYDLTITDWIELDIESGLMPEEPAVQRMLKRLHEPGVCGLIIDDQSRLIRPDRFTDYAIFEPFRESGKLLYSGNGARDLRNFGDRIQTMFEGEMNAHEKREIKRRTMRAREERRRKGVKAEGFGRNAPTGVKYDFEKKEWSYDFPDAERVRQLFKLWIDCEGTLSFSELSRRVGLPWVAGVNSGHVRKILSNPLYKGVHRVDSHWERVTRSAANNWSTRRVLRAPEDCYENVVLDPPLVTPREWAHAQKLLAKVKATRPLRHKSVEDQAGTYPGLLDCAVCGCTLGTSRPQKRKWNSNPYYYCRSKDVKSCSLGCTGVNIADPIIDAALQEKLGNAKTLNALVEEAKAKAEKLAPKIPREAQRRLAELANRETRVQDAFLDGLIDRAKARKQREAIVSERVALESQIATAEEDIEPDPKVIAKLVDVFKAWTQQYTREEKRALLNDLGIRVRLSKPAGPRGKSRAPEVKSIQIGALARSIRELA